MKNQTLVVTALVVIHQKYNHTAFVVTKVSTINLMMIQEKNIMISILMT